MAINNNYEYLEENELLYNMDSYVINSGSSIELIDGTAQLKNINTNDKSNNFFGNGSLGTQSFNSSNPTPLEPSSCYFEELIVNDSI
jgi:hypothetical protein